jgi:flagellar protein FliS
VNAQVALKSYGNVKVNAAVASASPHELVQMLFDGLLERIAQMRGAIEQNNIELKNNRVNQAISILFGLRESLDKEQGEDLSNRLDGIYDYVQRRLWQAHMKNDLEILNECTDLITEISSAWQEIGKDLN